VDTPRPSLRTNRTRRVPHPVLIGHAASLSQVLEVAAAAVGPAATPRAGAEAARAEAAARARAAAAAVVAAGLEERAELLFSDAAGAGSARSGAEGAAAAGGADGAGGEGRGAAGRGAAAGGGAAEAGGDAEMREVGQSRGGHDSPAAGTAAAADTLRALEAWLGGGAEGNGSKRVDANGSNDEAQLRAAVLAFWPAGVKPAPPRAARVRDAASPLSTGGGREGVHAHKEQHEAERERGEVQVQVRARRLGGNDMS